MEKHNLVDDPVLRRLADALGVTVDQFFIDVQAAAQDTTPDECLRLWSKIATEEGRRQALEAMRVIARIEQGQLPRR